MIDVEAVEVEPPTACSGERVGEDDEVEVVCGQASGGEGVAGGVPGETMLDSRPVRSECLRPGPSDCGVPRDGVAKGTGAATGHGRVRVAHVRVVEVQDRRAILRPCRKPP